MLNGYFVADYPLVNRRHHFRMCKQECGEKFKAWWEKKWTKSVECDPDAMKSNNWLILEPLRSVSDTMLQKRLLQGQQATLPKLVLIKEQWQAVDSVQEASWIYKSKTEKVTGGRKSAILPK